MNKLSFPISIVLASLIIGGFIYAVQINKQQSIERQQAIDLQEKKRIDAEKDIKDAEEANFANNLKCQALLKDLRQRWNNVVGIYYSDLQNTCIVKYTEKGETQEAPIETMQDN